LNSLKSAEGLSFLMLVKEIMIYVHCVMPALELRDALGRLAYNLGIYQITKAECN